MRIIQLVPLLRIKNIRCKSVLTLDKQEALLKYFFDECVFFGISTQWKQGIISWADFIYNINKTATNRQRYESERFHQTSGLYYVYDGTYMQHLSTILNYEHFNVSVVSGQFFHCERFLSDRLQIVFSRFLATGGSYLCPSVTI